MEIRDKQHTDDSSSSPVGIDRLWGFHGKLSIISTQFLDGVHYATRPVHFLPIINHLQELHSLGFVHGDIRAYNMVLQYDTDSSKSKHSVIDTSRDGPNNVCDGWLIDFDFGGNHGMVRYPEGYKHLLDDGKRPGKERNIITIMDDWQSLIGLIFHAYRFVEREGAGRKFAEHSNYLEYRDSILLEILRKGNDLQEYLKFKSNVNQENRSLLSDFLTPANLLRAYIDLASTVYDAVPTSDFEVDLSECGLGLTKKSRKASEAATGSPPKKHV